MESDIQAKILKWLKAQPDIYAEKMVLGNRSGLPDIRCCIRGRYVAFEVKQPGEDLSALQGWNFTKIAATGGYAFRVTSLEEVKAHVKTIRDNIVFYVSQQRN